MAKPNYRFQKKQREELKKKKKEEKQQRRMKPTDSATPERPDAADGSSGAVPDGG